MSIPTDLSATQATLPNKDASPTFPSFMRMQAPFFTDDIFDSPLLLNPRGQLESDFQSNSRVTNISRPAFSYPVLNGLGIHCHTSQSFFKDDDVTDQQFVPPAGPMALPTSSSSGDLEPSFHAVPMLPPDQEGSDDDPFTEVYKLLSSIEATVGYCTGSGSTLQYFDSDCQESWPRSDDVARSAGEEIAGISFPTSHSSLAGHSSSESTGDYDLLPRSNSPMLGPFPDINMFDLAYMNRVPDAGINPADIMRPLSPASSVAKRSASPLNSSFDDNSPTLTDQLPAAEVLNSIVEMLSNTAKKENVTPQAAVLPASRPTADKRRVYYHPKGRIMNEFAVRMGASKHKMSPISTDEPFAYQIPTPTAAAHRSPLLALPFQSNQQAAFTSVLDCGSHDASEDTPVLNAHLGINLTELVDRADKYRARFPGRAIDKKWLMAYAGKLTKRGELLEDYRCYVNGCTQKNKRRDHILVHVGSHVDQRLFVCSVCPMRFLRKNECKRHEASHSGERPFVCAVCPPCEDKTFVRQDLLKRHLKRAHNIEQTEKQNQRPSKKVKLESRELN
ncbi:hypothetical protein PILCRDRAFT_811099 [Piloderma croceum F 1598]|uniref:C2H2-type domain-containing protein n=1 Tax=Piloderma croceum (strain F 1598) TaxID=765440 RepID=A0A0C3BVV2_PILCF|nr:hypothetical protein PILCRDRAFT_811099 [Piloderma croceum F 1598]